MKIIGIANWIGGKLWNIISDHRYQFDANELWSASVQLFDLRVNAIRLNGRNYRIDKKIPGRELLDKLREPNLQVNMKQVLAIQKIIFMMFFQYHSFPFDVNIEVINNRFTVKNRLGKRVFIFEPNKTSLYFPCYIKNINVNEIKLIAGCAVPGMVDQPRGWSYRYYFDPYNEKNIADSFLRLKLHSGIFRE